MRQLAPEYPQLEFRWPALSLEWVNKQPTPRDILDQEVPILREAAPELPLRDWAAPAWQWPVTMLPAFEAVKCAAVQGHQAADRYQWRVREAFFAESRCISMRHVLIELAEEVGLAVARLQDELDSGRQRAAVLADSAEGWRALKVQGSPTLVLADGSQHFAPAMPRVEWAPGHRVRAVEPAECQGGDCLDVLRGILDHA